MEISGDPGEMHDFFFHTGQRRGRGVRARFRKVVFSSKPAVKVSDVRHRVDSEDPAAVFSPCEIKTSAPERFLTKHTPDADEAPARPFDAFSYLTWLHVHIQSCVHTVTTKSPGDHSPAG